MKTTILTAASLLLSLTVSARTDGGITAGMLEEFRNNVTLDATGKAVRNALNAADINVLAVNAENAAMIDTEFSDKVESKGITDQKRSGRCWLFTGLNVLRADVISKYSLKEFTFSQSYCFFWDQLEKSNLFLQAVIDTRDRAMDDREVDWLFSHPIGDGGTFTGVANLVMKYGLVPSSAMPESRIAESTSQMSRHLATILRQDGLELRRNPENVKKSELEAFLQKRKTGMLSEIYRFLTLCLGVPPTEFEWEGKKYTPRGFYDEILGYDLNNNYVMLMNDPLREYGKVYEIKYDRHLYDGQNWLYLNLPVERIKEMAIASIRADRAMYFSCDVRKFYLRDKGVLDLKNYDYESLLGIKFPMTKAERVLVHDSGSSHAMTLMAVDVKDGKPVKWMVENSWGPKAGWKGHLIMTDEWFDEYMFRLVVERRFVPADLQKALDQKPVQLPVWDPMYLQDE
ncbi:MAG: C1 family peptidase [Bacteroidales bacterium]|nr:C1 family peptidase [Bacteroidales bacterium]